MSAPTLASRANGLAYSLMGEGDALPSLPQSNAAERAAFTEQQTKLSESIKTLFENKFTEADIRAVLKEASIEKKGVEPVADRFDAIVNAARERLEAMYYMSPEKRKADTLNRQIDNLTYDLASNKATQILPSLDTADAIVAKAELRGIIAGYMMSGATAQEITAAFKKAQEEMGADGSDPYAPGKEIASYTTMVQLADAKLGYLKKAQELAREFANSPARTPEQNEAAASELRAGTPGTSTSAAMSGIKDFLASGISEEDIRKAWNDARKKMGQVPDGKNDLPEQKYEAIRYLAVTELQRQKDALDAELQKGLRRLGNDNEKEDEEVKKREMVWRERSWKEAKEATNHMVSKNPAFKEQSFKQKFITMQRFADDRYNEVAGAWQNNENKRLEPAAIQLARAAGPEGKTTAEQKDAAHQQDIAMARGFHIDAQRGQRLHGRARLKFYNNEVLHHERQAQEKLDRQRNRLELGLSPEEKVKPAENLEAFFDKTNGSGVLSLLKPLQGQWEQIEMLERKAITDPPVPQAIKDDHAAVAGMSTIASLVEHRGDSHTTLSNGETFTLKEADKIMIRASREYGNLMADLRKLNKDGYDLSPQREQGYAGGQMTKVMALVKKLDFNPDGIIKPDELQVSGLLADKDGKVTLEALADWKMKNKNNAAVADRLGMTAGNIETIAKNLTEFMKQNYGSSSGLAYVPEGTTPPRPPSIPAPPPGASGKSGPRGA